MKCISLYVLALGLLAGSARVPVPTAHAAGRSAPQAVLGATRQAWRHAMGRPSPWQKGDSMGWGTCPGTRMDQVVVTFADGRAEMVSGLYCSGHPSARARLALALRYAPP